MPVIVTDQSSVLVYRRRASRNYKILLYESNLYDNALHPVTGVATPGLHTAVAELTTVARDKKLDLALNKAGQVSFRVPLSSVAAGFIFGYEIIRSIVVYVDNGAGVSVPVWSGMIWNAEAISDNNSLNVTCVGWFELLNHREFRRQYVFTNMDAGVIATRLLSTANNQIANANVVSSGSPFNPNTSAEDLVFSAGDFENSSNFVLVVANTLDAGYPQTSSFWAVSGSNSLAISSTNKNVAAFVGVQPPVPSGNTFFNNPNLFPVDAGATYEVRAMLNLITASGTMLTRTSIKWFNNAFGFISQTLGTSRTSVGVVEVKDNHVAPSGAVYAQIYVEVQSGVVGSIFGYWDAFTVSKTAVLVRPTPITIGTVTLPANPSGANRTRTYQAGSKIGPAIEELSQIEAGFDFEVATVATTVNSGATLLRQLNIRYGVVKASTSLKGIGSDRVNTIFGLDWGPNNIRSLRESHDSSKLGNRINGRAPGKGAMVQDLTSVSLRGIFEDSVSISDANVADNIILYYAGAEVAFRLAPFKIFNLVPFPWDGDIASGRVPRLFIDYIIGDVCYFVADSGAIQVGRSGAAQPIRIFGASISIDMEGNEKVESLQTAAS